MAFRLNSNSGRLARLAGALFVAALSLTASAAVQKKYLDFGWQYRYIPPSALLANADSFKVYKLFP